MYLFIYFNVAPFYIHTSLFLNTNSTKIVEVVIVISKNDCICNKPLFKFSHIYSNSFKLIQN